MAGGDAPLVSACLIVRDESEHIARCLESIRSLADEVIVVDTGSRDHTVELARELGAEVFEEPWRDDFSFHRNQAIERATGRWILSIDADEEVFDTDIYETREKLAGENLPNILLVNLHLQYPNDNSISMVSPRIFRRSAEIRYIHPVHEQLDVIDAPAALSNVTLLHHGYNDIYSLEEKERRNLRLAETKNDGSSHMIHCIMRSSFSLNEWLRTIVTAKQLITNNTVPILLKEEACALGAAASFNLRDSQSMLEFVSAGISMVPNSSDIRLMALLAAIANYLLTLKDGDSTSKQLMLRPPMFYHSADTVKELFDVLSSRANRRSVVQVREEDQKNEGGLESS